MSLGAWIFLAAVVLVLGPTLVYVGCLLIGLVIGVVYQTFVEVSRAWRRRR